MGRTVLLIVTFSILTSTASFGDSGGGLPPMGRSGGGGSYVDCIERNGWEFGTCTGQTESCQSCFDCCDDFYECGPGGAVGLVEWEACIGLCMVDKVDCGMQPDGPPGNQNS